MGDGLAAIDALCAYLEQLDQEVADAIQGGRSLDETMTICTDPWQRSLEPAPIEALSEYRLPPGAAERGMQELCRNLHRLNILATYRLSHG